MVEKGSTSERATFDPSRMAHLETELFKNLYEGKSLRALQNKVEMHMEQWNLKEPVAVAAVNFIDASQPFLSDKTSAQFTLTGRMLLNSYYHLISRDSGLNFNPDEAALAYVAASDKSNNKNPVPMRECAKLFGIIYSIDQEGDTLWDAMDLRGSAFRKLGDWGHFERYIKDYYQYLKWSANKL